MLQQTWDPAEAAEAARTIQRLWTENLYTIGLVQAPAALLINKRIRNSHPGAPVFMFEWAEDNIVRERLWVAAEDQIDELFPGTHSGVLSHAVTQRSGPFPNGPDLPHFSLPRPRPGLNRG